MSSLDAFMRASDRSAAHAECVGLALGMMRNALVELDQGQPEWARKTLERAIILINAKQDLLFPARDTEQAA